MRNRTTVYVAAVVVVIAAVVAVIVSTRGNTTTSTTTTTASSGASAVTPAILTNALTVKKVPASPLNMGGSSFDANLVNAAWTQWTGLSAHNASSLNTYQSSSSGTGRAGVDAATPSINIGFSDVPLNFAGQDVADTTKFVQVPIALGGVAVITNIRFKTSSTVTNQFGTATTTNVTSTGATSGKSCAAQVASTPVALDGTTLGNIFAGSITTWNNAAVLAQNPALLVKVNVPVAGKDQLESVNCLTLTTKATIAVDSRTAGSGTTFIFRDYLAKVDPTQFPTASSAAFASASATFSTSATLAPAVAGLDGSIGYVEYGYALQNHLASLRLKNAAGMTVSLSAASVSAAASAGLAAITANASCPGGFSAAGPSTYSAAAVTTTCFSITDVNADAAYPIAGFSYAIVPKTIADATVATVTTKFLLYLSQSGAGTNSANTFGQNLAAAQAYVPLPAADEVVSSGLIDQINAGANMNATD